MDNPNLNYRGSQRALKMLQAQIQQKSAAPTAKKPAERMAWPPKSTSLSSLDPASFFNPTAGSSTLPVASTMPQAVATASTPVHRRAANSYNSPEASIPSNGGILFNCENSLDLESSRLSNLPHNELLAVDFNSNNGFTNDFRAEDSQNIQRMQTTVQSVQQNTVSAVHCETVNEEDETRSSMCFSFSDGKVTAMVTTPDGAYCIAGFSSGAIRLFDLTTGGNTDPEDRFGYQIGFIDTARNAVQIHLELGSSVGKVNGSSVQCCHLFAVARQGSTTMLVVDIGSLREVHKKRGFISVAGGGVQTLSHSDARLKGLTCLSAVSCVRPTCECQPGNSQEATCSIANAISAGGHVTFSDRPEISEDRGYTATYRLITGRGFCNYHIWEVKLEARPIAGVLGSPAGSGGNNGLCYTQQWTHLFQGAVNGPTMNFAHSVNLSSAPEAPIAALTGTAGSGLSLWGQCQQRALLEPDLSTRTRSTPPASQSTELVVSDAQKDLRYVTLVPTVNDTGGVKGLSGGAKPQTLKDTTGTYAASQDGTVLFGGKYELIITVLAPASAPTGSSAPASQRAVSDEPTASAAAPPTASSFSTVNTAFRAVFSLNDFVSGAIGRSSKKASRHLREISSVYCTPDGCYALILCTDNAVLLYSVCDVTGKSSYPTRTEGSWSGFYSREAARSSTNNQNVLNSGAGFLTYLFEADDTCNLDLSIAYITTEADRCAQAASRGRLHSQSHSRADVAHAGVPACSCGIYSIRCGARRHHLPPQNVLISISWWQIENPMLGGVLKVCKLAIPPATSAHAVSSALVNTLHFQHIVPTAIATSSLVPEAAEATRSTTERRGQCAEHAGLCALCGDVTTKHWNRDDLTEAEKSLFSVQRANRAAPIGPVNLTATSCSTAPAEKEKRPPKKKEAPRETEQTAAFTATKATAPRDKRQKLAHSQSKERLGETAVAFASPSDYFLDINFRGTDEVVDLINSSESKQVPNEAIDVENDDDVATRSQTATPANEMMSQVPESSQTAETETADRHATQRSGSVDHGAPFAAASPSTLTAKELRQELERIKAENRRLRVDTDLTMRKADRRFELEMAARRNWKQEKAILEGTIAQMHKEQQRWGAEKDKVRRLHGLLQDVLHTASATLQYSSDDRGGDATLRTTTSNSVTSSKPGVFSPASKLSTDLSSVNKAYENGDTGVAAQNVGARGPSSNAYGGSSVGYSSASNSGRKPFFCIVCLDHTARVAIQPCGHICFCTVHAEEMQRRIHDYHHSKCPLCQAKIEKFITIQGIDMPDSF